MPVEAISLEQKLGRGYNVLAEIDLLRNNPHAKDYVLENELTAACEAVGSSHGGMWSSYRPWDAATGQFRAFGSSFTKMLETGVEDVRRKIGEGAKDYGFELDRRQAELNSERRLALMYQRGYIKNNMFLTISPYPEEVSETAASSLGYKPEEQLGKLRFEVFVEGVRQTIELGVTRGSVRIFQSLMMQLGYDQSLPQDSTSFLQTQTTLGSSASYLDTMIDVAKRYDSLLEGGESGLYYFCGQKVKDQSDKDYEKIISRQRWVREQGKEVVAGICDLDVELAQSLNQARPTKGIMASLEYWVNLKDQKGAPLLSSEELATLEQTLVGGQMSQDAAFILKKNELVRMWSVLSCVINEDQAKQMFGETHVNLIKGLVGSGVINTSKARQFVDQVIAEVNPVFLVCGGLLGGLSAGSLFSLGLLGAKDILFGASDGMGSLFFECPHPACRKINKRNPGQIREDCEHCHRLIQPC